MLLKSWRIIAANSSAVFFSLVIAFSVWSASDHVSPSGELSDRIAALFDLLGLSSLRYDRRPGGFARQPLGLEPLPVGRKCLLCNLVLSHCLSGTELAKCLARFAFRFGDRLGRFKLARCLSHY